MNEKQRLGYIFDDHNEDYISNRLGWLYALLSDIRTLIDGGQGFVKGEIKPILEGSHGAGNVSIPILVCTGLELASKLYAGNKLNSTDSVIKFIEDFFPDEVKKIPRILWNGIRNGTNHIFIPNTILVFNNRIQFSFFVNHSFDKQQSYFTKSEGKIIIHINSIQFYHIFEQAIDKYKSKLETNNKLQCDFIAAWKSKEQPLKPKDGSYQKEVKYLLNRLTQSNKPNLFV
jgi:hypothetical protein